MNFDLSIVFQNFPEVSSEQAKQLEHFARLIAEWNSKINLISRSDIDNLPLRHILHSLAIAKVIQFKPSTRILDVGTGGGFPGIPLAIAFPECNFHLIDSIGKKVQVVQDVIKRLELSNATAAQQRAEKVQGRFDFVVARAVTQLPKFMNWIRSKVHKKSANELENGVLYLKGGDVSQEFSSIKERPRAYPIYDFFPLEEFKEKYVAHIPLSKRST